MKKIFNFAKSNSGLIFKLWVDQLIWSVVGLMVSWPLAIILSENENYSLFMGLAGIFTVAIYCFRFYDIFNQIGLKYSIRKCNSSYEQSTIPSDTYGLKVAAIAYIPTAILVILYTIFSIISFNGNAQGVLAAILYIVPIHSMYNCGFLALSGLSESVRTLYTVLALLPAPFFAWLGYYLGIRNKGVIAREKVSKE